MKRYRKKPVIIEAIQWNGENDKEVLDFIVDSKDRKIEITGTGEAVYIETLEGTMKADINDYIIKGVKGEFYPCKPDIFEQTYEEVNDA